MYWILLVIQYVGMAALFFEILYVSRQHSSRIQTFLVMLLYATVFNIAGYTLEMQAATKELAMQSLKFTYLGKPFIIFIMYLFVMEYCGVKLSKKKVNLFFGISVFVAALVFTNEHHSLFYSSISYTKEGLFPHLVLGHGLFYNLYIILVLYFVFSTFYVCVQKYRKDKSEIMRKQVTVLLVMVLLTFLCLVLFLFKLTDGYDSTTLAYLVAVFLFQRLIRKYKLFDTLRLAQQEAVEYMSNGLIVLNIYGGLVYTNPEAEKILEKLQKERSEGLQYLEDLAAKSENLFLDECSLLEHKNSEKCVYEVSKHGIYRDDKYYGRMIVITEITDSYYYTERLQHDLDVKTKEVVKIQRDIIASFAAMIEARDGITGLHIKNTGNLVTVLVNVMKKDARFADKITDEYAEMTAAAARLHDIGKIAIPDRILQKEGKLTDEEFAIMKTHPAEGAKILENTIQGMESMRIIRFHMIWHCTTMRNMMAVAIRVEFVVRRYRFLHELWRWQMYMMRCAPNVTIKMDFLRKKRWRL